MDYAVVVFISDGVKAFVSAGYGQDGGGPTIPNDDVFKQNAVDINGGVLGDYSVYGTSSDEIMEKIFRGDYFVGTLDVEEVTGLDFSIEEAKEYVDFSYVGGLEEIALEVDGSFGTVSVKADVLESDGVTIDTSFTDSLTIDMLDPEGFAVPFKIEYTSGTDTFLFQPTKFGIYTLSNSPIRIGDDYSVSGYRVKKQIQIKAYLAV